MPPTDPKELGPVLWVRESTKWCKMCTSCHCAPCFLAVGSSRLRGAQYLSCRAEEPPGNGGDGLHPLPVGPGPLAAPISCRMNGRHGVESSFRRCARCPRRHLGRQIDRQRLQMERVINIYMDQPGRERNDPSEERWALHHKCLPRQGQEGCHCQGNRPASNAALWGGRDADAPFTGHVSCQRIHSVHRGMALPAAAPWSPAWPGEAAVSRVERSHCLCTDALPASDMQLPLGWTMTADELPPTVEGKEGEGNMAGIQGVI